LIATLERLGDKLLAKVVPAVPVQAAYEYKEQCGCDPFNSITWYRWCIAGAGCGACNVKEYHGC
jgi:hypothetical protein